MPAQVPATIVAPFELPFRRLFEGYCWEDRPLSLLSTTTAFKTGIDTRDRFLGIQRCLVCGVRNDLEHAHIIPLAEPRTWEDLKSRSWLPHTVKSVEHEPRNGLTLCPNHRKLFDHYKYFIRFIPEIQRFVLVNHSQDYDLIPFHGKMLPLDIGDRHAPFPSPFLVHEARVRGFNPFSETTVTISELTWQDWVVTGGIWDEQNNEFRREPPPTAPFQNLPPPPALPSDPHQPSPAAGNGFTIGPMDETTIERILAATWKSASWRACQMEGTSWAGTAEENIETYRQLMGGELGSGDGKTGLESQV
ncbi:hypothetical protein FB451DRAFT_1236497 [Mycena latifolia]|nr:hypothetical protein FB451DRAFT_1236497 [Mycena latifolia]